ncbi:bifunctional phosphoglucose/phosphomannose isomerase [Nanoarchaeota archaeon]
MENPDKEDMIGLLNAFYKQINPAIKSAKDYKVESVNRVLVCGLGGSAISGDILRNYVIDEIEVTVCRDYTIPKFVNKNTLAFVVSYSGNTEETISAYKECMKKQAKIVAITSGGKLAEMASLHKDIIVKVPAGIQPRLATGYLFFPMVKIMMNSGLISDKLGEIVAAESMLKKVQPLKETAQEIAKKLKGKIPIIYASNKYSSIAEKWKTDINENSKCHAFYNLFSEFNHNEINGYVNLNGDFYVIIIRADDDHPRIQKRMQIIKKLIKEKGVEVQEIKITGKKILPKIFSTLFLGVTISYYLALELETDPTPVKIIEDLKLELKK